MGKMYIILLMGIFSTHTLFSQILIERIEDTYNALDSISYIENIISSYKKDVLKGKREMKDLVLELRGVYDNMDSIQRQNILDSIMKNDTIVFTYKEYLTKQKVWKEIYNTFAVAMANANFNIMYSKDSIEKCNALDSISR
ncbi:MAG: hypothetical protein LBR45_01145 [Bacteroidales bacterium]|jgi:hypothetical protein|nr:hypothetical protein [Bacteroidales bacterium]